MTNTQNIEAGSRIIFTKKITRNYGAAVIVSKGQRGTVTAVKARYCYVKVDGYGAAEPVRAELTQVAIYVPETDKRARWAPGELKVGLPVRWDFAPEAVLWVGGIIEAFRPHRFVRLENDDGSTAQASVPISECQELVGDALGARARERKMERGVRNLRSALDEAAEALKVLQLSASPSVQGALSGIEQCLVITRAGLGTLVDTLAD